MINYVVNINEANSELSGIGKKACGILKLKELGINIPPTLIFTEQFYSHVTEKGIFSDADRQSIVEQIRFIMTEDINLDELNPYLIIRFGEKTFEPYLPKSIPFFGFINKNILNDSLKEIYRIRERLIFDIVKDQNYNADDFRRFITNSYKDVEEMYQMIFEFLILCVLKLERIQQKTNITIDKSILIQRQPNYFTNNGIIRMANGMAYSSDPYGEEIEDYGRYSNYHVNVKNLVKKDLSEMKTEYKECYFILKDMLNKIRKAYCGEPRFVEYIVAEKDKVWLLQNRSKWRKDKSTEFIVY